MKLVYFVFTMVLGSSSLLAQELSDYSNADILKEIQERLEAVATAPSQSANVGYSCEDRNLVIRTHSTTNGSTEFIMNGVPNIGLFAEFCDKQKADLSGRNFVETPLLIKLCTYEAASSGENITRRLFEETISILPDGSVASIQKDELSRVRNPSREEFTAALNECLDKVR